MLAWRSLLYSSVRSLMNCLRVVGGVLHRHHARALFAGLGFQQNLIHLGNSVVRQQRAQHLSSGSNSNTSVHGAADQGSSCVRVGLHAGVDRRDFANRQKRTSSGCWTSVETKFVNSMSTRVHFAFQEQLLGELGNGPRLAEQRRVLVGELRGQLPPGARDELRGLAPGGDERRVSCRTSPLPATGCCSASRTAPCPC